LVVGLAGSVWGLQRERRLRESGRAAQRQTEQERSRGDAKARAVLDLLGKPTASDELKDADPVQFPKAFDAALRTAVKRCHVPVEIVLIDCSDSPCVAVLRVLEEDWEYSLRFRCKGWQSGFGGATRQLSFDAECDDGTSEQVAIISPYGLSSGDEEERRMTDRQASIKGKWRCASDVSPGD